MGKPKNLGIDVEESENVSKNENFEFENLNEKRRRKFSKSEVDFVPPDGGWGWMVVIGGFITIVLGSFPLFSFSIMFSPLLMSSGVSSTKIAWIFNIHGFIWSVYTVFLGPLSEEYGWRRISIIGGIANFLSIFLSVFVVQADLLFITFSIFGGIGGSTGFTVCFLAVSKYFLKHRGFALAITTLGSTVSSFFGPLVATYLLENFGYMGASLIYSAIILNQCVGGALFQPVEWHMKPTKQDPVEQNLVLEELLHDNHASDDEKFGLVKITTSEKETLNMENNLKASTHSLASLGESLTVVASPTSPNSKLNLKSVNDNSVKSNGIWYQFTKVMKLTYENLKTLKFLRVKLISVAYGCLLLGYINFQMWVPFIVTNAGYTLEVAAWCVSIASVTNGLGKIGMSLLSDRKWFSVQYGFMFGIFLIGLAITVFPFARKLELFFTIACFWGFGVGVAMSLHATAMISVMGVELLPALLGVSSLFKGLINLTFGPLVGMTRDASSSYIYAMILLGGVVLFGFCLWLLMPLAVKYDHNKRKIRSPDSIS